MVHATCSANAGPTEAQEIKVVVVAYTPAGGWDHHDDGSFEVFDVLSLQVEEPDVLRERSLTVLVEQNALQTDSPLRTAGTRFRAMLDPRLLDATVLFFGALRDVVVVDE